MAALSTAQDAQETDRARGALYGLAIGDALGMPTQMLSRRQITERWGPLLAGFEPAPPGHPIAAGMPAGSVTDDTEQAVLLGRLLLAGPVDPRELAAALVAWERDMAGRGSLDLLGPSTRRAIDAVLAGTAAGRGRHLRRHERGSDADHPGRHQGRAGQPAGPGRRRAGGEPGHAQHVGRAGRRRRRCRRGQRRRGRRRAASRRRPRQRSAPPGWAPNAVTGWRAPMSRRASGGQPGWSRAWLSMRQPR